MVSKKMQGIFGKKSWFVNKFFWYNCCNSVILMDLEILYKKNLFGDGECDILLV